MGVRLGADRTADRQAENGARPWSIDARARHAEAGEQAKGGGVLIEPAGKGGMVLPAKGVR